MDLNFACTVYGVWTGEQPTANGRNILSDEGVYMMKHLKGGVKKGAFDDATAEKKFEAWKTQKTNSVNAIVSKDEAAKKAELEKRMEAEKAYNKAKQEEIAKKKAEALAAEVAAAQEEAATEEAPAEETPAAE